MGRLAKLRLREVFMYREFCTKSQVNIIQRRNGCYNVKGQQVELLSKEVIHEPVEYYNIATKIHINLFANGILTSSRFNNIYRIENMKYVKEDRQLVSRNNYPGISDEDFEGYRLSEQPLDIEDTKKHLARLNALKK